jgi:hypothetical protein
MKFTERFEAPKPFIGGIHLLPLSPYNDFIPTISLAT